MWYYIYLILNTDNLLFCWSRLAIIKSQSVTTALSALSSAHAKATEHHQQDPCPHPNHVFDTTSLLTLGTLLACLGTYLGFLQPPYSAVSESGLVLLLNPRPTTHHLPQPALLPRSLSPRFLDSSFASFSSLKCIRILALFVAR